MENSLIPWGIPVFRQHCMPNPYVVILWFIFTEILEIATVLHSVLIYC